MRETDQGKSRFPGESLLPYRWPKKSSEKNPKKVNSLIYKEYTLVQYEDGTKSYVSPEDKLQLLVDGKIKQDVERGTSMKAPKEPETDDSDSGYEVPIRRDGRPKSCEDLDRPIRPEMKRNSSFPFSDSEAPGDGGRINLPPYIVPVETSLTFPMTKRKKKDKKKKEVEKDSEKLLRNVDDTVIDFPADFRVTDHEEEAESKRARPSTGFWGRIGKRENGEPQQQQKTPKNRFTVPWTKPKEKSEPEDEEGGVTSSDEPEVALGVDPKPFSLKFPRLSWTKGKKEKMGSLEGLEGEKKKNLESESHSDDNKDVDEEEGEKEKPEIAPADANKSKHFAFKMPKISLNRGRKDKTEEDPEGESERGKKRDFDDVEDEEEEEKPEPSGTDKPKHFVLKMPKMSLSRSRKDKTEEEPEKENEGDFHDKEEEEEEKEEKPDTVPSGADKSKRFSLKMPKLSLNKSRKDKIEEEPEKVKEGFHDEEEKEEEKEEKPEPVSSAGEKPKRFSLKMPKLSFNRSGKEKKEGPEEPEEERSDGTLDSKHSEEELEERPEVKEELMRRNILEAEPRLEKPEEIFPVEEEQKSHGFPRLSSEVPKEKKWRNKGKIDPNPLRKMFGKRGAKRERDPSPAEIPGGAQAATETHPEGDEDQSAGPEDPEPGPGVHGAKSSEDEGDEEGEARDGEVASGHLDDGSDTESADHGTHKSSMATLTSGKRSGSLIGGVLGFFKTGKTDKKMLDIADNGAVKTNLPSVEATPEKAPPEEPPVEGSKPDGIVYAELDMARFPGNVMRREDEKTEYAEIIYPGTKLSPERAMEELRKSRENLSSSRENLTEVDEAFSTMTTPEGKKEAAV